MREDTASYSIDPASDADIAKLIVAHTKASNKKFRRIYSLFGNNALLLSHLMNKKIIAETIVINNGKISDYPTTLYTLRFTFNNFDHFIDEITPDDLVILVPPLSEAMPALNLVDDPRRELQKRIQNFIEALDKKNSNFILFYGTLDKTNHFPIHWRWGHSIKLLRDPSSSNRTALYHLYLSRDLAALVMQQEHYGQTLQPLFHAMFEVHAANHPDTLAVVSDENALTYGQLNKRANQCVQLLVANGLNKLHQEAEKKHQDCVVAIAFGRNNPQTLIAELATEKAGVTKLLVNTDTRRVPVKLSLESIINSGAVMLITNPEFYMELSTAAKINGYLSHFETLKAIFVDETDFDCSKAITDGLQLEAEKYTSNPNYPISPQATLYLGETSGTTGAAKFARIPFGGLPFATSAHIQALQLQPGGRTLQLVAKKFDARFLEISMTLGSLGTIVLSDYETYENYQKLASILVSQKITCLTVVPALLEQLLTVDNFPFVTNWLVVGDGVDSKLLDKLWDKLSSYQQPFAILFGYGTTQTTIQGSYLLYSKGKPLTAGWPAFGLKLIYPSFSEMKKHRDLKKKIFITQQELSERFIRSLLPADRPQEVLVLAAGPCRMKGYVNGEEKSDQAGNEVFYNTGDKAFLMPDGSVSICERSLRRPKIYGQIVSLKTIEECIAKLDSIVEEVRVVAHTIETLDGKKIKKLAAYIVPIDKHLVINNPSEPTVESMRTLRFIREELLKSNPTPAVPALVNMLFVETLPYSENKKTPNDPTIRKQWPIPCLRLPHSSVLQEELNHLERYKQCFLQNVQQIAATILGLDPIEIGLNDRLDELGFDSMLRMRFVSQLKTLNLQSISINDIKFQKALKTLSVGDFQKHCTLLLLCEFLNKRADIGRRESDERVKILENSEEYLSQKIMLDEYRIHNQRSLGTIEIPFYLIPSISGLASLDYGTSELLNLPFQVTFLFPPTVKEIIESLNMNILIDHYVTQIKPKHGVVFLGGWSTGGWVGIEIATRLRKQNINVYHFLLDTKHPHLIQQSTTSEFVSELSQIGKIIRKNILAILALPETTTFVTPTIESFAKYHTKIELAEYLFTQITSEFEALILSSKQFPAAAISDCRFTLQAGKMQLLSELTCNINDMDDLTQNDNLILAEKSISQENQTLGWNAKDNKVITIQNVDHFQLLRDVRASNEIKKLAIGQLQASAEPICRGIALAMQHKHKAAVDCFNTVEKNNPKNVEYLYYRSLSNFNLGKYQEAYEDIKTYVSNSPNSCNGLFVLAKLYHAMNKYKDALSTLLQILDFTNDEILIYAIAPLLFGCDESITWELSDGALKNKLDEAISKTPILKSQYIALQITLKIMTNQAVSNEEKEDMELAIKLDPTNPKLIHYLGRVELKLGNYAAAEDCFMKASERGGISKERTLYFIGLIKLEKGEDVKAIELFSKVIDFNKDNAADALLYRSIILKKYGKNKKALTDLTAALERNEDSASSTLHYLDRVKALNMRGIMYKEDKNLNSALNDFIAAANLDNKNFIANYNAGLTAKAIAQNLIPSAKSNDTARLKTIERHFLTANKFTLKAANILTEGSVSQQKILLEAKEVLAALDKFRTSFASFFNTKQPNFSVSAKTIEGSSSHRTLATAVIETSFDHKKQKPKQQANFAMTSPDLFFSKPAPISKPIERQDTILKANGAPKTTTSKPAPKQYNQRP